MAAILEKIAKLAIPAGLAVGGIQSAMYDGKFLFLFSFARMNFFLTFSGWKFYSPGWSPCSYL